MAFPVSGSDSELAQRLWSVYELERHADQATTPVSFALATVGITYMATTVAIVLNLARPVPTLVSVLLPLAPIGLFTSLTSIDASSQARSWYLDQLEKQLNLLHVMDLYFAGYDTSRAPAVPAPAWRHLTRPLYRGAAPKSRLRASLSLALHPYILAGIFVVAYAIYILIVHQPPTHLHVSAAAAYLALMGRNFHSIAVAKTPRRYQELVRRRDRALYEGTSLFEQDHVV